MADVIGSWQALLPPRLAEDIRHGRPPVFFIGSGFGREALPALPTGGDLASDLVSELGVKDGSTGLAELLQYLKNENAGSDQAVYDWLKAKLLHSGTTIARPGGAYHLLLRLPIKEILTTNYDLLLPKAASEILCPDEWKASADHEEYERFLRTSSNGAKVCGFVHGSFHDHNLTSVVATTDDYIETFRNSRWLEYIGPKLRDQSFVFIGYSLRDFTTWTSFLSALFDDPKKMRPHVLVSPSGGRHEREFWSRYRTHYVPLKAHQLLIALHDQLGSLNVEQHAIWAAAACRNEAPEDTKARLAKLKKNGKYKDLLDVAQKDIRNAYSGGC